MKKTSFILLFNMVIKFNDLQEAIIFFYEKISELLNNVIEFYDNNKKIFTWDGGKGITLNGKDRSNYNGMVFI